MARIVHVSATLATGIYTIICTLAKCQLDGGHEVFLVGCTRADDSVPTWLDDLPSSVTYIELPMEREIDVKKDIVACQKLRRILRNLRPDVVHLHSSKAGAIGRIAALFTGAQVIYQPNGFAFLRKDVSQLKSLAFGCIETILSILPGRIIASSESEHQSAQRFVFVRKLDLVKNSIELPEAIHSFHSARTPRERWKVGTCGRISPQKDPAFFAEVARLCGAAADFSWIGGGSYPVGHAELAAAGVNVSGVVSRDQAILRIADLDVYIQTSAWEGMPISVLEAMALGVPVVVRDVVGNRDLLQDVAPDLIVTTPEAMANIIQRLRNEPEWRSKISHLLKSHIVANHSPQFQSQAFDRLYGWQPTP